MTWTAVTLRLSAAAALSGDAPLSIISTNRLNCSGVQENFVGCGIGSSQNIASHVKNYSDNLELVGSVSDSEIEKVCRNTERSPARETCAMPPFSARRAGRMVGAGPVWAEWPNLIAESGTVPTTQLVLSHNSQHGTGRKTILPHCREVQEHLSISREAQTPADKTREGHEGIKGDLMSIDNMPDDRLVLFYEQIRKQVDLDISEKYSVASGQSVRNYAASLREEIDRRRLQVPLIRWPVE